MSRQFLITGLTSAAIVATMGLAVAQSQDESALGNTNINGTQNALGHDLAGPPAMPAEAAALAAPDAGSTEAPLPQSPALAPADPAVAPAHGMSDAGAAHGWSQGGTEGAVHSSAPGTDTAPAANAQPATPWTAPAGQAAPAADSGRAAQAGTTADTSAAPADSGATRIELNSPDEPLYNLQGDPMGNNYREGSESQSASSRAGMADGDNAYGAPGTRAPRADRN